MGPPLAPSGNVRERGDVPGSAANAIVDHLIYARAQRLLLDADHGSIVRQHPWAAARREVRVRRRAEDGARDARHGRQRDAGEQQLQREPKESRVFGVAQVGSACGPKGRKELYIPANQGWMAAMRMLSAVTIGSSARIRPSTPCFEALYCGAFVMPIQDAESIVRPNPR
jgi:hypothetical protein